MSFSQELSFSIGKFRVTPSARVTDTGDFAPSVSIRRGQGAATLDKVFRFTRRFHSHLPASSGSGQSCGQAKGAWPCHGDTWRSSAAFSLRILSSRVAQACRAQGGD
jgi:hypothetical protein